MYKLICLGVDTTTDATIRCFHIVQQPIPVNMQGSLGVLIWTKRNYVPRKGITNDHYGNQDRQHPQQFYSSHSGLRMSAVTPLFGAGGAIVRVGPVSTPSVSMRKI